MQPAEKHAPSQEQLNFLAYNNSPPSSFFWVMKQFSLFCLLAILFTVSPGVSQAQTPDSRDPGKKRAFHAPQHAKATKRKKQKVQHTAQYEFYKRVEMAAREKQKILKQLSKAQFSDHRHFGHKRLPKRRPTNKIRYCSECGIRH